ncbi:MAG: hypothetical protein WC028_21010 [Candidatus Obscuribacterales bacterium]
MKLKLTESWYANRAKAEESCMDIAAGASIRPITAAQQPKKKTTGTAANTTSTRTGTTTQKRVRRNEK